MPVFRVERNKGYTVMSNYHLRDKSLSLKAKGLLSQILRTCMYNHRTRSARCFFRQTAFIFLAIRQVCLQKMALPARKTPRTSGIL